MSIKKRLEKLEATATMQVAKYAVTEIWLVPLTREPGDAITSAARWTKTSGAFVSISDEELAKNMCKQSIRSGSQINL